MWLVGGFAASPYLIQALREALGPNKGGVTVQRPDTNLLVEVAKGFYLLTLRIRAKAVANGDLARIESLARQYVEIVRQARGAWRACSVMRMPGWSSCLATSPGLSE